MSAVPPDLLERVRASLADRGQQATPEQVAAALRADHSVVGDASVLAVVAAFRQETLGAGPLEPLLAQPTVSDVLVNGPDAVYVDRGGGVERVDLSFPDDAAVRRLAQRLAATAGQRLDDARPYADVRLSDGTRLHAVLASVASPGTCLSLRVPPRRVFGLDEMVDAGSLSAAGARLLGQVVRSRLAYLVTGGTGTGKTTLLAALLSAVPHGERLVLVEDTGELRPRHPHVVRLEGRPPNVEGAGGIAVRELVRQALRMRPDRLVVGEVRGGEVVDLLAALNTGHEGGCGTIHANSAGDLPARVEALAVPAGLDRQAVHSQLAAAVHVAIHLVREPGGRRRLAEIRTLERDRTGLVQALPAVRFSPAGEEAEGPGARRLAGLLRR